MTNLSFYPGEDDQEVKKDPSDTPMDDPETEEEAEGDSDNDSDDDGLMGDDGIIEGDEEIE